MANWVFWVRLGAMDLILGWVGNFNMNAFVPGLNFTLFKNIIVSLGTTTSCVGVCVLAASTIGFPVPFMMQLASASTILFMNIMLRIVLGPAVFTKGSPMKSHSNRFRRFISTHAVLCSVYPLFKVFYNSVPTNYRGIVVVVLPIWRFAAKCVVVRVTRGPEDFMPQFVALSVDFFSTLFISVCMTSSGSLPISILLIAGDITQSMLEFRELRENANVLVQLTEDKRATGERMFPTSEAENIDLLSMMLDVARNPRDYNVTSLECVRLWACLPHPLTRKQDEDLLALQTSGVYTRTERPYLITPSSLQKRQPQRFHPQFIRRVSAKPVGQKITTKRITTTAMPVTTTQQSSTNSVSAHDSKQLVLQGLQLLFHSEYLALVEYVECIVPLVFVIFKSVLEQLPNIVYYPDGAGSWSTNGAVNILVLLALEIVSLALFDKFLQRKFDFSPLYQLAFVLETQNHAVQTFLFIEVLMMLQYELLHFGADFTLRFEWLHDE